MPQCCKHVTIHGRVQGVGYRAWTERNARRLGLAGWVKNRQNGTVEALFCGEEAHVQEMLEECRRGPLAAKVTNLEIDDSRAPDHPGFITLPTD